MAKKQNEPLPWQRAIYRIETMPRNCVVFCLPRRLTRSVIYGSQLFYSHKWPTVFVRDVILKENRATLSDTCVDHYILLLKHLANYMHFITNGYKRFLETNSSDPRQCVPFKQKKHLLPVL